MLTALIMNGCKEEKQNCENPFFCEYNTPFQVPPFDKIKATHFDTAFKEGMRLQKEEVERIVHNTEEPDFTNTIEALDKSGELLLKVSSVFFNLSSANTNDTLQKIQMEMSPLLSAHRDEISMDPKVFERVKNVYEKRDRLSLNSEQNFLLENYYKAFIRNGAALSSEKQEKLKALNQRISVLKVQFNQNLLAETNGFKLIIDKEEDLAGLSEAVIQSAAETAQNFGMDGQWVFTTQKPSMIPFLQYGENRNLREKLYMGYINRGNNGNEYDNKALLSELLNLRTERAQLLGYESHSHYVLEPRMAQVPDHALALLNRLWDAALPIAKKEREEMQKIIDKEGGKFQLASWDWWYYAEKLRKQKYDLDENELRPYFMLDNVREGAFMTANKLYGITFYEIQDIPRPHPEAKAFEVKEADGSHLGVLYMDFHPRDSKRQGAWCNDYREYRILDGKEITPVITVVCNFTKASGDEPALLSLDEVETLFHEFGHALDGLFAKTSYNMGFIAWDFVELPSQIMEHWATWPEVLKMYAKHYETGEPMPDELIEKLKNSKYFNQGFATVEYLAASLLDFAYHTQTEVKDIDIEAFEKTYFDRIGLIPEIISRYRSTYFAHIIGGYDSGYYSYIWAAVLDNDAFGAFEGKGIFDKETATSFRKNILEKNGIMDAMEMFVNFRGREPKEEFLLKNRGLQ